MTYIFGKKWGMCFITKTKDFILPHFVIRIYLGLLLETLQKLVLVELKENVFVAD